MKQIDRIKNMNTDEMAQYLMGIDKYRNCINCCVYKYCHQNNYNDSITCQQITNNYLESEV